jgi:Esterase-like activity of phytase/LVIVD repeat
MVTSRKTLRETKEIKTMRTRTLGLALVAVLIAGGILFGQASPRRFKTAGSFGINGVAEIVDATADGNTLYFTNASNESIGFVDISDLNAVSELGAISVAGEPTSVSIAGNYAAATVWVDPPEEGQPVPSFLPGQLVILDLTQGSAPLLLGTIDLGWHPDSVKLTEINGQLVGVVSIENEPVVVDDDGLVEDEDEPGSPHDISPAGFIQVVTIDVNDLSNSTVVDVALPTADLAAAGCQFPSDPQPEFVAIQGTTAAVSLQENNGIAIVDISNPASPSLVRVYSKGIAGDRPADMVEDDAIGFTGIFPSGAPELPEDLGGNPLPAGLRTPDAIAFSPDGSVIYSADEGEINFTGGRGWSAHDVHGNFLWEEKRLERLAIQLGHYPEGRSENKGIEMEGMTVATFGNRSFAFVLSERGSFMAVYRIRNNNIPKLLQILPTGLSPEGVVAIPARNLVVTSDETSGTLSFFVGTSVGGAVPSPDQPRLFGSVSRPFSALSGLCDGPGSRLYAVPDNAIPTSIFRIKTGLPYAPVVEHRKVRLNGQQMRYDGEGICRDTSILATPSAGSWWGGWFGGFFSAFNQGFWIASEGDADEAPNLLVQVSALGNVLREIQLPFAIDEAADPSLAGNITLSTSGSKIRSNGFEGVTLSADGRYLFACIQREFSGEFTNGPKFTRIARYDLMQLLTNPGLQAGVRAGGDWDLFWYPLDATNESSNWVGLSEITFLDGDTLAVIERDKGIGSGSLLKKVYSFSLAGLSPDTDGLPDASDTIVKTELLDILDAFFPYEKVEGLAPTSQGLWIGLDNDGGEVESRLINAGAVGH